MKNILVDNKSEAHLIKFLKSLPDNQIKQFYDAVEWTPYPVLVIKEFQRRFKPNDDEFVTKLLESVNEAKTKGQKIGRLAKLRGLKLSSSVRARAKKTVSKNIAYSGFVILWFWTWVNVFLAHFIPAVVGFALLYIFFRRISAKEV